MSHSGPLSRLKLLKPSVSRSSSVTEVAAGEELFEEDRTLSGHAATAAGTFYPADPGQCRQRIEPLLAAINSEPDG